MVSFRQTTLTAGKANEHLGTQVLQIRNKQHTSKLNTSSGHLLSLARYISVTPSERKGSHYLWS